MSDLPEEFLNATVQAWFCPDRSQHGKPADGVTVRWYGDTAICTTCGRTNRDAARGVDPAGTTEPQGDEAVSDCLARLKSAVANDVDYEDGWHSVTVSPIDLRAALAEVERLRARVQELEQAGKEIFSHGYHRGDCNGVYGATCYCGLETARDNWRAAVRGDDLDPRPEEDSHA